ncbi:MAG TPA: RimK family alpha-L-glutamate ligase [Pirellulales bacterium]|jgi:ribosomal protein S6--L-glutamate ligase|nr:RimK family alpha-L-glutamate ligase [Pirellulales bacterium]
MLIALLCSPTSWYLHDLRRAAGDRHQIVPLLFRDLESHVGSAGLTITAGRLDLSQADAVLVRTMPPGSLEQVVLRMDLLARLEAAGIPVINPPRAIEAAVDKYLTTAKLAAAGLPVPRTRVCQTVAAGLEAFDALDGDVVLKPLFGGEGRGIARLEDRAIAERTFSLLVGLGAVLYVQEFVRHPGYDVRVLLVGSRAYGMRRVNPFDWRTNISRGATAEPLELTAELVELARRAATTVGASLAGVDLLLAPDGRWRVIEVNAVPGWQALGRTLSVDVARVVLDFVAATAATSRARAKVR